MNSMRLFIPLALFVIGNSADVSAKQLDAYAVCPDIEDPRERLACYDSYAGSIPAAANLESELILASLDSPGLVSARSSSVQIDEKTPLSIFPIVGLLSSDGPNHIRVINPRSSSGLRDDRHVEISLGFKYPLIDGVLGWVRNKVSEGNMGWVPDNLFLSYRGEFDFYAIGGTRYDSSPIVTRNQVPGLALEWRFGTDDYRSIRFGAFHQSNGQSLNNKPSVLGERFALSIPESQAQDPTACQLLIGGEDFQTYSLGRQRFEVEQCHSGSTDFALAQVSRAYNFWQLRYRYSNSDAVYADNLLRYEIELRTYDDTHDEIFWDPQNSSRIEDYDGLRMSVDKGHRLGGVVPLLLRAELKAGTSSLAALKNFGGKVSIGMKTSSFVSSLFYYNGYGKEPSTYHIPTEHWGLEIELR